MQQDSDYEISELKVDGGATGNELLMQMQADISNLRVNRSRVQETTVLGAAFVAGIGAGFWKSKSDISSIRHTKRVYTPSMTDEERTENLSFWAKAVERSKEWIS
jgi:glycerol kinase